MPERTKRGRGQALLGAVEACTVSSGSTEWRDLLP